MASILWPMPWSLFRPVCFALLLDRGITWQSGLFDDSEKGKRFLNRLAREELPESSLESVSSNLLFVFGNYSGKSPFN